MIYICVTTRNHAETVGLVLWKVRQVFIAFRREYQLLVADESERDATSELLERYQRVLPMTVLRAERPRRYGASLEALVREALARSDRPKRDAAILLPPDFAVSPDALPDLVRRVESGADVVVAETPHAGLSFASRVVRHVTPWLLRPGVRVPGVRDLTSHSCAMRLVTLKLALRDRTGPLLESDGICARAELIARAAAQARQVAVVPSPPRRVTNRATDVGPLALALELFRAGRRLRIAPPQARVSS